MKHLLPMLLAGALLCACDKAFPPQYQLDRPRILALRSEPVDLAPDGGVTLDALVYLPPGTDAQYHWSWCAQLGGAENGYSCAITQDALAQLIDPDGGLGVKIDYDLGTESKAVFNYPLSPELLRAVCASVERGGQDAGDDAGTGEVADGGDDGGDVGGDGGSDDGGTRLACRNGLTVSVLLTVQAGGQELRAMRQLNVLLDTPTSINLNPTIEGVELLGSGLSLPDGGTGPDGGLALVAQVPESAADTYQGPIGIDGGQPQLGPITERLELAWYVDMGLLAHATTTLASAPEGDSRDWTSFLQNWWTPPTPLTKDARSFELILVVRDGRGGVGWLRKTQDLPQSP